MERKSGVKRLIIGLHQLEQRALPYLKREGTLRELVQSSGLKDVEAMRALQWLEGKGCLRVETREHESVVIKEKGMIATKEGLPERQVLLALKKRITLPVAELSKFLPKYDKEAKGAVIGALKRAGIPFITIEKKPSFKWINRITIKSSGEETLLKKASKNGWRLEVAKLNKEERISATLLLKRKGYALLEKRKEKIYFLSRLGEEVKRVVGTRTEMQNKQIIEQLTHTMLTDGSWKKKTFRPYNVTINVPSKTGGRAHFVNEAIDYIKRIWLDLGFEEMEGNHVQTAFWDLDSLFVPQDHPAREMQDTFYLKEPVKGKLPVTLLKKVKATHEDGGNTGSKGWRYTFSEEEAAKNLLRTHTTVLSAQTLLKIKEGKRRIPGKYFSVGKVYRNEALDWKHLFEFYQVEGIVVDEHADLRHLKGYLREFFGKMGFPDVRIRPAHFPYTEPSAEVDVWDVKKKGWVELGGAGIFRPEVVKSILGKDVPVLAWGLGMERIIKEYYDFDDIRDLYRNDVEQLKSVKVWLR